MMRVLSLGAGVQSSTLLLMVREGELQADCAIFADTQWEPRAVYDYLAWLETVSPIPIHRVTAGDIRQDAIDGAGGVKRSRSGTFASMPLFLEAGGMARRQCTKEYKLEPIWRKVRALLKESDLRQATLLMGISLDEVQRMKQSRRKYLANEYPLIDKRMSRNDCVLWLQRHDYPIPPKSACIGCPYRNNAAWREIKADPEAWAEAVEFDERIRAHPGLQSRAYLHRSLKPLPMIDLTTAADRGQLDMFGEECEGMCGV